MKREPGIEVFRPPEFSQRIHDRPVNFRVDTELTDRGDGHSTRTRDAVGVTTTRRCVQSPFQFGVSNEHHEVVLEVDLDHVTRHRSRLEDHASIEGGRGPRSDNPIALDARCLLEGVDRLLRAVVEGAVRCCHPETQRE